ncbi:hypothetical protein ACH4E7_06610 [Kitasatospora sp. NPDC018058]|uniref:hypothetical protein n=1 Tax=Kitasatospora sp. NPDC018058 TaxID=3364025 RepID=UPI0037BEACBB
MTVLHSRNADAADPADVAGAADVKDPQDAAAEPDLREDLGRYAELGAFTLSADTHAWYAAVDTVATPDDARGASTVLAELRGRDLQQTWEAVTALAAEVKLDEPDSVAKTALLVELLQRVHRTSAVLTSAAYDVDLTALAAATADSNWRRENGVKLSWLRGRSLRKQAAALATDRRVRREDLHEALTSAEIERRAWAALAPAGTLPRVPADGSLVDRTAQAFEAINTGLRDLTRLLPDHDLDGLAFADLVDLVERLAADEGTLYRLPTVRSLRATLEEAGLGDLLAELTAAKADRRAAEAAYAARQALAGGQRDGLADSGELVAEEQRVEEPDVEESDVDAEAAARQALAGGQRDGLAEEAPVSVTAPVQAEVVAAEVPAEADTEVVEAASDSDPDSVEVESAAAEEVTEEEAPAAVVSLPAPSPAADDLVAAATAALAEAEQAEEPAAEVAAVEEAPEEAAETVAEAVEPEAAVEVPAVEVEESAEALIAEPEAVEVEESAAEVEVAVEAPTVEVEDAADEVEEPVEASIVEAEAEAVVVELEEAAAVEVEAAVEVPAVEVEEPAAEVEESAEALIAEPEAVEVEESAAEVEVAVEAPTVEVEDAADEVEEPVEASIVEAEAVVVELEEAAAVEPVAEVETVEESAVELVAEPEPEAVEVEEPTAEVEVAVEAEEPVAEPEAVEEAPAVEPEPAAAEPAEAPVGRPEKPDFTPGRPVTAYSADELLAVVRWIDGDGTERSDEELLRAAMKELGFARLGPRIKEALGAAVSAARG